MKRAALLTLLAACTTTVESPSPKLVALDAEALCAAQASCGAKPKATCTEELAPIRVTAECKELISKASCEELSKDGSHTSTVCFPPCEPAPPACGVDGAGTVTSCLTDPKEGTIKVVLECHAVCAARGGWTGVCGKTYEGQTPSDTDVCWCKGG